MKKTASSKIKKVSNLKYDRKTAEEPFEWWGPSPDEARRTMSNKAKGMRDKRMPLKEAVGRYLRTASTSASAGSSTRGSPWRRGTRSSGTARGT
jgi:glutaconate CoA-transferase subunit A